LVLGVIALADSARGAVDPDPAVKKIFDKMLNAIKDNDREAFIANGTDMVKKQTTDEGMTMLNKFLGARLKKGFEPTYLGQLKQSEHQVHLWKLTFKDDGDDILVRLAMKDGKVGGFFLQ